MSVVVLLALSTHGGAVVACRREEGRHVGAAGDFCTRDLV